MPIYDFLLCAIVSAVAAEVIIRVVERIKR